MHCTVDVNQTHTNVGLALLSLWPRTELVLSATLWYAQSVRTYWVLLIEGTVWQAPRLKKSPAESKVGFHWGTIVYLWYFTILKSVTCISKHVCRFAVRFSGFKHNKTENETMWDRILGCFLFSKDIVLTKYLLSLWLTNFNHLHLIVINCATTSRKMKNFTPYCYFQNVLGITLYLLRSKQQNFWRHCKSVIFYMRKWVSYFSLGRCMGEYGPAHVVQTAYPLLSRLLMPESFYLILFSICGIVVMPA